MSKDKNTLCFWTHEKECIIENNLGSIIYFYYLVFTMIRYINFEYISLVPLKFFVKIRTIKMN